MNVDDRPWMLGTAATPLSGMAIARHSLGSGILDISGPSIFETVLHST